MNPETEFREGLDELASHYKSILDLLGEDFFKGRTGEDSDACGKGYADTYTRILSGCKQGTS